MKNTTPSVRPLRPEFSSGPCPKRTKWHFDNFDMRFLGRSHRSKDSKARLKEALTTTHSMLGLPENYRVAIVAGSDTGAVEMALWSLLGARPVTILAWDSFGLDWVSDVRQLVSDTKLDARIAPYGHLPNLDHIPSDNDIVFTWNGTTSGVALNNADWIDEKHTGLAICDATSAIFAYDLPFEKLDVITYSWQKVLGGEAAHGMIILSPKAVERLETYTPPRPLPKIFRMTKNGQLNHGLFNGETINTPSMLCLEDYIDALKWADSLGGVPGLIKKTQSNAEVVFNWLETQDWVENLAVNPVNRSVTSLCLNIVHRKFIALDDTEQRQFVKRMTNHLETSNAAYDIAAHAKAPPGIRIWCGPTVEISDVKALLPWLEWAFNTTLESWPD